MNRKSLDPKRFTASRSVLIADRFMTQFIKIGGLLVIAAVFGIFLFILIQILPLFQGAKVQELASYPIPSGEYSAIGVDEWAELPFVVRKDGVVDFVRLADKGEILEIDPGFDFAAAGAPHLGPQATAVQPAPEGITRENFFTSIRFDAVNSELIFSTATGFYCTAPVRYASEFEGGQRKITATVKAGPFTKMGDGPIHSMDIGSANDAQLIAAVQTLGGKPSLHAVLFTKKRAGLGGGESQLKLAGDFDLTGQLGEGLPRQVLVDSSAQGILVATEAGEIDYIVRSGSKFERLQSFKPFQDLPDKSIATINFLFGDASIVVANQSGENRIFSLFRKGDETQRTFGQTKSFPSLGARPAFFDASLRNKAFLLGGGNVASLRFGTTESVRWQKELPFEVTNGIISGKYNRLLLFDNQDKLHVYTLDDPHPEASFKAFFGKVWYEGYSEPVYAWQSTGGSDEFEPKLSLMPVIVGTLKGTFYAMLFAVPIALAAAIYTSQFLQPRFKTVIKPTMEIMASLPSVVLGFLAALWLAPILDTRVPSLICMFVLIPGVAFLFGYFWSKLPPLYRNRIQPGYEFFVYLPLLLVVGWLAWQLGPWLETVAFRITLPDGKQVADFRLWWPSVINLPFEQRNAMIVGFAMGFAVIPIIFTIAEDSLSNVPSALKSASLALGASRWQTTVRVILPTASRAFSRH